MKNIQKIFRYYYWLFFSFFKKNFRQIIISSVIGFFFIFLFINYFPIINNILFKKTTKIGVVGTYNIDSLPQEILDLISNPLITVDTDGKIIPVLISKWDISKDNKVYQFKLKDNLFWSDGKPVSAYDLNLKYKGINIKAINNNTIEFDLNQPLAIFPIYLSKPLFKFPLKGIAGLYQVQNYSLNKDTVKTLVLSPNKAGLSPKTYYFYENEDKMITAYKKGEINQMSINKKTLAESFSSWKNTNVVKNTNYSQIMTLFFNNNNQLLASKDFRKAIAYATPDFEDLGEKATSPIPPTSWGFSKNIKTYSYNLEKAEGIISKVASKDASINFYTFYDYINVAEEIKKNLETAGLKVNLRVLSYIPQEFDIFLTVWNPPVDPDQYYFWHSTQIDSNITNYKNIKVDKLLEDGRKTGNIEDRKRIYQEFQKNLMEDLPAYFIYHPYSFTIERK